MTQTPRGWWRWFAWVIVACGVAAAARGQAMAHSVAVSRLPPPDARLNASPKRVVIEFGEPIEPAFSKIEVSDRMGATVAQGNGPTICQEKSCKLDLPVLSPGKYTVTYSVLSVDGHVVKSDYAFTVTDGVP